MEKFLTPEEIIIRLKKLIKFIEYNVSKMSGDISSAQARVIFPLVKTGKGHTMQELVEMVGVDKAFVSRTVADLEAKDIVVRGKKADSSERNYKIMLTSKGQKIVDKIKKTHQVEFEKWQSKFTEEELLTFRDVLIKLTDENC